jgi:hypothetical protein
MDWPGMHPFPMEVWNHAWAVVFFFATEKKSIKYERDYNLRVQLLLLQEVNSEPKFQF